MSASDAASPSPKYRTPNGSRLGARAVLAHAMLQEGFTGATIEQAVGISNGTVTALRKQKVAQPAEVEKIRRGIRDRLALVANDAINHLTGKKLKQTNAVGLMKVVDLAMHGAGIAPPSVHEHYAVSIQKYFVETPKDIPTTDPQPVGDVRLENDERA